MVEALVVVLACAAGGLGAVLRHVVDSAVQHRVGDGFPWGTVVVNALGSFAAGAVVRIVADLAEPAAGRWALVVLVGVLGGFTTFSSAMLQSLKVGDQQGGWHATGHLVGTWLVCLTAAGLGMGVAA